MVRTTQALRGGIFDYTLPVVSLAAGKKMSRKLRWLLGETRIEDLWLPYFCVSSNLTRAEVMVHREGPLWLAIRASGSVAAVFPPVVHNGDLLIDGATLNNVPIDVMRERVGSGTLIASDVSPPIDLAANPPYGEGLSGFKAMASRLNPFSRGPRIPNIAEIIQRTAELGSIAHQKKVIHGIADLYLRPPVETYDMFDFAKGATILEIGYDYAVERVAEWINSPSFSASDSTCGSRKIS
jgi:predicted acylesterase/phospholipase RssA